MSLALAAAAAAAVLSADWRTPRDEDLLIIETTRGKIIVELQPLLAPAAVDRIRFLARRGDYDGLLFHRVIDGFVDQTGNPNNRDGGGTELADLQPEFDARAPVDALTTAAERSGEWLGYLGSLPVAGGARIGADRRRRVWGLYCAGVMGMGRQAAPDSANSEIFLMRGAARRLDHEYTAVGRAILGQAVIQSLAVGVPPPRPDRMIHVRVASDLPPSERPRIEILRETSAAFTSALQAARSKWGADFSPCSVAPRVRRQGRTVQGQGRGWR